MSSLIQSVAGMQYPVVFVQNCTNSNRFNRFGLGAITLAAAMADSGFALQNCRVGHTVDINVSVEASEQGIHLSALLLQYSFYPIQVSIRSHGLCTQRKGESARFPGIITSWPSWKTFV